MNYKTKEILILLYWTSGLWLPLLAATLNILDFDEYRYFWIAWGISFPVVFAYGLGQSRRD